MKLNLHVCDRILPPRNLKVWDLGSRGLEGFYSFRLQGSSV